MKEMTRPGVHRDVLEKLRQRCPPDKYPSAIDLGAGEGAFTERLRAQGYNVTAVEICADRFRVPAVKCLQIDLNSPFSAAIGKKYDFVVAVEIIEHLESPRNFFRQCKMLLNNQGVLVVTSPNVQGWNARFVFLRHGILPQFSDITYRGSGHITPLFAWQVEQIAKEQGFSLNGIWAVGDHSQLDDANLTSGWLISSVKKMMSFIFKPFMRGLMPGTTNMYILTAKPTD